MMTNPIELSYRRDFLIGCNSTNATLAPYTPVGIGDACRVARDYETLLRVPMTIYELNGSFRFWGVCREAIAPGKCGEVQISGVTPCRVGGSVVKPFADISTYGLSYSDGGWKLLFPAPGDERALPMILLGSMRQEAYTGYFKVVSAENGTYRCVNGADPEAAIAGRSDLGDLGAGSITPDADGVFYIYALYENFTYQLALAKPVSGRFGMHQIAHLAPGGAIVQDHLTGYIHWNAFYAI